MSACDSRHSRSSSSSYLALLNTLASDLDHMLNDLCVSQGLDDTHAELTHRLRGQNFLEPYMQGLGVNHGDCGLRIERSTLGTSSFATKDTRTKNIYRQSDTVSGLGSDKQATSIFDDGVKGFEHKNDVSDNFFASEELSARSALPKNSKEDVRNVNLKEMQLLANQNKDHLNAILKLANKHDVTNDLIKRLTNDGASEAADVFFGANKIREIVSTSRSGHLIERQTKSGIESSEEEVSTERAPTGDTSDKDESDNGANHFKIGDVNDNTSDGTLSQRDLSSSDEAGSENSDCDAPCGIGLLERLIRSHPVWYLPGIQRAGAVHLLQGKEEGNFVVRQSSQPNTMAISVRLPAGKGPYIEHYLIQASEGQLSLESSENAFDSIPSLIAHYSQCCDELPVQLTLPRTIREAKNRQQLSSFALLGQEFWRYPMANPRPPEGNNNSPSGSQSGSLSSFGSGNNNKVVKSSASEIILDLVPLHPDSQPQTLLRTFKGSPTTPEALPTVPVERERPTRPNTLDLICTTTGDSSCHSKGSPPHEKTGMPPQGAKTPPPPPPRWTKPLSGIGGNSILVADGNESQVTPNQQKSIAHESDNDPSSISLNLSSPSSDQSISLSKSFEVGISSPQSDQTNLKSVNFEKENASLRRHFHQEKRLQHLVSPVSDQTNFVSKNFERLEKSRCALSAPAEKLGVRSGKRHRRESKSKESRHYQECDILESPTVYYRSNIADKQSDYEDIWGTETLTTFKPMRSPTAEGESWRSGEAKITPDLLEKLDAPSAPTPLSDTRSERTHPSLQVNVQAVVPSQGGAETVADSEKESEHKQNSPFYAEPADAIVVRRKMKQGGSKSRHSDPSSFNNWPLNANPYFSGGNILERIDSRNDLSEESASKAKPSLSVDNIVHLKSKDSDSRTKPVQKPRSVAKAKPVQPPKVGTKLIARRDQSWTVDSSWEFIGNEESESRESERRFPSLEQQMDSENAASRCTVHQMITQRFPQFRISPKLCVRDEKNYQSGEHSASTQDVYHPKTGYSTNASRISAYDNLTSERGGSSKYFGESQRESGEKRLTDATNVTEQRLNRNETLRSRAPGCDASRWRAHNASDTLRSRRLCDSGSVADDNEDAQTIFSEPWDSSRWENLLLEPTTWDENVCESTVRGGGEVGLHTDEDETVATETPKKPRSVSRGKSFKERLDPLLSPPRLQALRSKELTGTGSTIRSYALHLASDKSTTFAQNIDNFIACTLESKETNPQVVMRNMRQFMSGMKNYLVKHGEREFEKQVEKERMKLKSTEFLNLDAILEGVMHKLVVRPLKEHLYKLFVDEYTKNGGIQLLHENINYARTKPLYDLGIKAKIMPPSEQSLETICHFISRLQEVDSPLEKLDHLLTCISAIFNSVKSSNQGKSGVTLGADDFLPLFVWVLVQSGFIAAEIEAEYMWGLLHPSLLSGEGGYYLTTLSSAVHVLKNFKACDLDQSNGLAPTEWNCGELRSVLKIVVPDELHGSILTKTLPVRPNMTTRDVCKIIAHKIRITNPQDYGLFKLVDGEETLLNDTECPQDVKCTTLESGKHCMLAYKRIDAKIAWPRT